MLPSLLLLFALPAAPPSFLQQGLLALQQGDMQTASADLQKASELEPHNGLIWTALADVYWRSHQETKAAAAAQTAEHEGHGSPVIDHALAMYYSRAGQFAKAASLEEAFAATPQADPAARIRAAQLYLQAGDYGKGLALAKQSATNPQAAFLFTQELLKQQRFNDADQILGVALEANPKDPQLLVALGVTRYGERRFDDAITTFLQVIQIDPQIDQPYRFIGRMLDQAGPHLPEITTDCRNWAQNNPENGEAQLILAKVLMVNDPTGKEPETLLRRSIELAPNNWEAHYQLGVLLEGTHRYQDAATELNQAIQLNPKEAMPHYHLARVYDRLGKPDQAAEQRAIHRKLAGVAQQ